MTDTDDYREAFYLAWQVILELEHKRKAQEVLHGFVNDLTSGLMDQVHALAIAHGQVLGKEKQAKRNAECERLKKELAVAEAALIVPAIPYRE